MSGEWLPDPLTRRVIREMAEERRKQESILHRPATGPMPWASPAKTSVAEKEPPKRTVILKRATTIAPEAVRWLWPGWLARGKLHVIAGAPGAGKTTIALSLAATVTRGDAWPDGSRCPVSGRVVIWSGEDDPGDTLVPRLMAAEANLSHVSFVENVLENGKKRSFDPASDIEPLREAINHLGGADFLIIDPIVSAVAGDSHKNTEVRRALQPLADLASGLGAALVGITHFSKGTMGRNPVERLSGSLAFGAIARVVMVAAKKEACQDPAADERVFCRAKSNVGSDTGGFTYRLIQGPLEGRADLFASSVCWGSPIEGGAREILGEAESVEAAEGDSRVNAEDFLIGLLAEGAKTVAEVQAAAKAHCLSWRAVERAKSRLGVRAARDGFGKGGVWRWEPPDTFHRPPLSSIDRQQDCSAVYADNGGLCEKPLGSDHTEVEL